MAMGLVAGVLVDDAIVEIENIVRHMRMGKSAYQASLDAADEIGLAVLATTMAIVAVFLPVALMPGIAGQYFKAFGFTVVVSVLMSLLVARMITPLIAAYFLRSHGVQPHADWKWMDVYLKVLNWSLDTTKAERCSPGCRSPRASSAIMRSARSCCWSSSAPSSPAPARAMMLLGKLGWPGAISFVLALLVGAGARLRRRQADRPSSCGMVGSGGFAEWHAIVAARWNARMHDHRMAMVGAGIVTLLLSIVLFGTLSHVLLPAAERRLFARSTSPCRRAARSSRPRRSPTASRRSSTRIPTSSACSSASTSATAGSTSCSRRTARSRAPSSSAACRRRSRRSPTRASASRARTAAARTATRATSCSISAATIRSS